MWFIRYTYVHAECITAFRQNGTVTFGTTSQCFSVHLKCYIQYGRYADQTANTFFFSPQPDWQKPLGTVRPSRYKSFLLYYQNTPYVKTICKLR